MHRKQYTPYHWKTRQKQMQKTDKITKLRNSKARGKQSKETIRKIDNKTKKEGNEAKSKN